MALAVYIRPTIPDNEGRTAFSTLRRLGVPIGGLERAVLLLVEAGAARTENVAEAIRDDESIFNANTHALAVTAADVPPPGEVWIASDIPDLVTVDGLGSVLRLTAWTLRGTAGPADVETVRLACERLLCNPAVQHVVERAS